MSNTRMIPTAIAESLCWEEPGNAEDGWTKVATEEGDDRRWSKTMTEIVSDPDSVLWAYNWEHGLTENQDHSYPWGDRYDKNPPAEIEVYRVWPVVKTVTVYTKKEPLAAVAA